jgi:hypothetical protein
MTIRNLWRGATALSAGFLLAVAATAPAQAATSARWRVDAVITPKAGMVVLSGAAATGKTDAWSAGIVSSHGGTTNRVLVEHFDGRRWRQFAVPARLQGIRLGAQVLIGASSASNVWVFELLRPWNTATIRSSSRP